MKARLAILALLAALPGSALAQSECTSCCTLAAATGDDHIPLDAIAEGWGEIWDMDLDCGIGESQCYANEPGGNDLSDENGSRRRMHNAIAILTQHPHPSGSMSWGSWANDETAGIEPHPSCGVDMYVNHPGEEPACVVHVGRAAHRSSSAWLRASSLVHEAAHCAGSARLPHTDCDQDGPTMFDEAWVPGASAYTTGTQFLWQWADDGGPFGWSGSDRAAAIDDANAYLNGRFCSHPGFNLVYRSDLNEVEFTFGRALRYHPSPDSSEQRLIRTIGLAFRSHDQGSFEGIELEGMWITTIGRDRYTGAQTSSTTFAVGAPSAGDHLVWIDAWDIGPGRVLQALLLDWDERAEAFGGPTDDSQRLRVMAVSSVVHPDGTLTDGELIVNGEPFYADQAEVVLMGHPHQALRSFELRATDSDMTLSSGSWQSQMELAAPLQPLRRPGDLDVRQGTVVECPEYYLPVGLAAASFSLESPPTAVDYLGLLCVARGWVEGVMEPGPLSVILAHPGFGDTPAGFLSEPQSTEFLSGWPFAASTRVQCPPGHVLSGLYGVTQPSSPSTNTVRIWKGLAWMDCEPHPMADPDLIEPIDSGNPFLPDVLTIGFGSIEQGDSLTGYPCEHHGAFVDRLYIHQPSEMQKMENATVGCAPLESLIH